MGIGQPGSIVRRDEGRLFRPAAKQFGGDFALVFDETRDLRCAVAAHGEPWAVFREGGGRLSRLPLIPFDRR